NMTIRTMWVLIAIAWSGFVQSNEPVVGWAAADTPVVVRGGTLIDIHNGSLMENTDIVINGDRIESITRGPGAVPSGATVLDAKGKYIIPGMLDLHVHYYDWSGPLYLNHGVTTVGSLGDTY